MLFSVKYNFLFVHIAKTGGTSVRAALAPLRWRDPMYIPQFIASRLSHATGHRIASKLPRHARIIAAKEMLPQELFDKLFKFAFVRNPWDKFVSSFTRECSNWRNTKMPRAWISDPERFQEWAVEALNPKRETKGYVGRSPRHTAEPQLDMITNARGDIDVDFIGRFENVVSDFEKVLVKIDQIYPLPPRKYWVLRDLNGSNGATEHYSFYYNDELIEKVRKVYEKDIEYFGYTYKDY